MIPRATAETTHDLLLRTSRTFALAIPLLPEPTRTGLGIAYLLFRVADTLEDAAHWSRDDRVGALAELQRILATADPLAARAASDDWCARKVTDDAGCRDLLLALPGLFAELGTWEPARRAIVVEHASRTAAGMARTLAHSDARGHVHLETLGELRDYCYYVAGIVGELVTALFVHDAAALASARGTLENHQRAFGEGLQLVNILKDARNDETDGRVYLPAAIPRDEVIELARRDLVEARTYISTLASGGAPAGFVAFTSLPVELAERTLDRLAAHGAGAKVPRDEVLELLAQVHRMVDEADHSASAQSGK